MCTPLVYRGIVYIVTLQRRADRLRREDRGEALHAAAGRRHPAFTASPVAADGKVYFASEDGRVFVIKADPVYQVVATNDMGESTLATPAFSEGLMFWRTQGHLVAVGN